MEDDWVRVGPLENPILSAGEGVESHDVIEREIHVRNVALAMLDGERIGLGKAIVQEQLLSAWDVDVHGIAGGATELVLVEALLKIIPVIHSTGGNALANGRLHSARRVRVSVVIP